MVLWCLILLLISAVSVHVHSQLDSNGFLSIDCGLSETSSYVDEHNLTYVSDQNFIEIGQGFNSDISPDYRKNYSREFWTVRYFPNDARNCYSLTNLTASSRYLIRGVFYYGNYDNLNKPPRFDIYVGSKFWITVDGNSPSFPETIITSDYDFLEVCLLDINQGFPFISALHLRKLKKDMYIPPDINSYTSQIILVRRDNFGASIPVVRYPDDIYDRWWYNNTFNSAWSAISTNGASIDYVEKDFETPSLVFQTAATTTITNDPFFITWRSNDTSYQYYVILHYYEILDPLNSTGSRDFYVYKNDGRSSHMNSSSTWADLTKGLTDYNISLVASPSSKLPPAMNAFELYQVASDKNRAFYDNVNAIIHIKQYYGIKKGWFGDPCFPTQFLWTGINCTYDSGYASITSLNLSYSLLKGSFIGQFAKLTALVSLDLSDNDLSGSLPPSLDDLTALEFLDITGNKHLSTTLPPELLKKQQNGSLTFGYTPSSPSSKKKLIILIAAIVPVLVIAVGIAIVLWLKRRKYNRSSTPKPDESFESNIPQSGDLNFGNHKFCYNDLRKITNDFKDIIGTGGYGSVYFGHLENGVQVAVKMFSQSSLQGVKEFLAEAENLARVHHKNLVSLLGCCIDKSCMALVYEYMQGGNLYDKLRDHERPLDWKQRLRIAYESALGLEYLHKACNPPLIHRDVKTTNILLSAHLEAKIADFGLSRAFNNTAISRVSTRVVGTPGYLDPEYYLSNQLSVKSDVFSFGIVLLEIITGRPPTNAGLDGGSLVQWVRQKLSGGDIEIIVDPGMEGKYDINSVWKVTDLACRCTEATSSKRPTMAGVAAELKESKDLVMLEEIHTQSTVNLATYVSQDSNLEKAYMGGVPMPGPSVR